MTTILEILLAAIVVFIIGYPIVKIIHSRKEIDNDGK